MGMVALTKVAADLSNKSLKIDVKYYGKRENEVGTFGKESIKENLEKSLNIFDVNLNSNEVNLTFLVFTGAKKAQDINQYVEDLEKQYIENVKNDMPTVIIDASEGLDAKYFENELLNDVPLTYLLGYSNWNMYSNSNGIAVAEGLMRYFYLIGENKKIESDQAYLKLLTYSLVNDILYQTNVRSDKISDLDASMNSILAQVKNNLETGNYIADIIYYREKSVKNITVNNFYFPWQRIFEIDFDVDLALDGKKEVQLPSISKVIKEEVDDSLNLYVDTSSKNQQKNESNIDISKKDQQKSESNVDTSKKDQPKGDSYVDTSK